MEEEEEMTIGEVKLMKDTVELINVMEKGEEGVELMREAVKFCEKR